MRTVLPDPVGQQRDVVYMREKGHCIALGTAGSGKTVMAVHRARHLSKMPKSGGKTLLVTFNGALVTYLRELVGPDDDVKVEQYHKFAIDYIRTLSPDPLLICPRDRRVELIERAVNEVRSRARSRRAVLDRPVGFFLDELDWLAGHGITNFAEYVNGHVQRVGRNYGLAPSDRTIVNQIRIRYRQLLAENRYEHDLSDLAGVLRRKLTESHKEPQYRHVVIDEGQDFSPEMIRSLTEIVPKDGTVTFFGDYAQQIYGSRVSWKSLGLLVEPKDLVRFDRNYRNTKQIARLAEAVADTPFFKDDVELVSPLPPQRDGDAPLLVEAFSKSMQIAEAVHMAENLLVDRKVSRRKIHQVAILLRNDDWDDEIEIISDRNNRVTRLHKGMKVWAYGPGIFYGPYAEARGLEFDAVVLPFCDADELPSKSSIEVFGATEAMMKQARELYIAVTRAKTELVILYSGSLTSLLPGEESDIYDRSTTR
ncbi:3'-5' exonuclease [Saccharothrix carnea]|nr:3'-5' exonuclease [Saccharothrix carnea]